MAAGLCLGAGSQMIFPVFALQGGMEIQNIDEISYLKPGEKVQAETGPYVYRGIELDGRCLFISSNPDVLAADENGELNALQEGYSIVTVRFDLSEKGKETWAKNFPDEPVECSNSFYEIGVYVSDNPFIYRLYNPNSGEHFYTDSMQERNFLRAAGWSAEGLGWNGLTAEDEQAKPVYRLYNPNAGDHHYTTDTHEKEMLVKAGWKDEGISFLASFEKGDPVYRLYNPNAQAGAHHFTLSEKEYEALGKEGWVKEGIAWYAQDLYDPSQTGSMTPDVLQ